MFRRLCIALILTLACAVPLRAADPITIYYLTSVTGPAGSFTPSTIKAATIAVDLANKRGGVRGRQLKLVILDDGSNAQNAVALAGPLIGKTQFMLGPQITASCLAVAPLLRNGPVAYCFTPGVLPPPGSFYFSSGNNNDDNMAVIVRYFRERGWKRIALITSTDATGQAVDRGTQYAMNLLENHTLQLVAQEHFGLSDVSVSANDPPQGGESRRHHRSANGPPSGSVLRGITDAGITVLIAASPATLSQVCLNSSARSYQRNCTS